MRRLPAATRRALLDAAALSLPTVDLVDPAALTAAEREGIVRIERGRVLFAHPLFATAVYAQADAPTRRSLHRRLAAVVSDPEERARHLALCSEGPDPAIARLLDDAAAGAGARGASDAAAELADLALELTPADGDAPCERLLAAAGFHFRAGDLERAAALLERAADTAESEGQRATALQALGQLHARRSGFAEALGLAARARDAAGDDPHLRVGIELDLAFYSTSLGDFQGAEPHARAAVELADALGDGARLAEPLAVLTMVEFLCGRGLDQARLARALALEDPSHRAPLVMQPRYVHGLLLLWTGQLEEALEILDGLRLESLELGRESDVPLLFLYLVWACIWLGDLSRAAAFAESSRETAALLDDMVANGLALSASALAHAHEGHAELARTEGAQAIALFEQLELAGGDDLAALGGRAARALGRRPCGGRPDPRPGGRVRPRDRPRRARARRLPPRRDRGARRAGPARAGGGTRRPARAAGPPARPAVGARRRRALPWAPPRGARRDRRRDRGARAGRLRARPPRAAARAGTDAPRVRLSPAASRRRSRAREQLVESLTIFEQAGARLWAERAAAEIERLGVRAPTGLTPTERRVAELAASGLSNREVAVQAFLSVKSVEANLTRVYRKLDIRSRGGLARALEADDSYGSE